MGVTGLWTVVQPCARPIKLETLNKRRLAVDASIWIYQFLKAVRDKEGNALRNSHVVGFFRRICKLLYFGIKPVFVFDGGAPVLKRQTIASRQKRREGHREDAAATAGKLLAVQMQRGAEEEATRRRRDDTSRREEEEVPDNPVYADETFMTEREKQQGRQFRKKDAYHLPDLQISLEEMGAPNDPRIMSREELEEYARQFHQGEDVNLYDFSKIDFDSPFFISLPATDRYNILNAARLRSRLRMGYSKEQLDNMFPDRMAFSKFQIERVKERNDLTQRLMNINGMNGDDAWFGMDNGQRIAGERGKEYVLVKDSTMEGGWVLGVVGNKGEGHADKPIDVDQYGHPEIYLEEEEASDDGSFEDVPVEGLNRLPKLSLLQEGVFDESIKQQLREAPTNQSVIPDMRPRGALNDPDDDSIFFRDESLQDHDVDRLFQGNKESDGEDLRKAIELSLESTDDQQDNELPEIQINRDHVPPLEETAPAHLSESDEDDMDFAAVLAQSKRPEKDNKPDDPFDGPLPFESIKLNRPSKAGRQQITVDEKAEKPVKPTQPPKENQVLPPWFSGEQSNAEFVRDNVEDNSLETYREKTMTPGYQFLKDHKSPDVIDVDKFPESNVVDLEASPSKDEPEVVESTEKTTKTDEAAARHPPPNAQPLTTPREQMATNEEVYEWDPTDDEASVGKQHQVPRSEPSPSPEFEDVIQQGNAPDGSSTRFEFQARAEIGERPTPAEEPAPVEEGYLTDPEEEDLMRQLAAEGEEYARFAATLNSSSQVQSAMDYEQELRQLRSQQKRDRRDADEVSQIMINECQQLLRLFGLPYITAPMEAEAQCAELVSLGLVDGIITDDSDIFLFGGTRVYKNMFNQSKFVECYLTSDMEKEYALHRQKLISFAHLLGSDYTEGIPGVGPVTALEILTEFSTLEEFREWWTQIQTGLNIPDDQHAALRKKFKKTMSKIFLPPSFPDPRVEAAYFQPEVDSDPSPFQWGVPDLHGLRNFLMATIGWSQERTDEVLVPVIRDMNRREQEGTQSNITGFFSGPHGAGAFAPRVRSSGKSRMEKAFSRLRQEAGADRESSPQDEDVSDHAGDFQRKGKGKRKKGAQNKRMATGNSVGDGGGANKKQRTKRGTRS